MLLSNGLWVQILNINAGWVWQQFLWKYTLKRKGFSWGTTDNWIPAEFHKQGPHIFWTSCIIYWISSHVAGTFRSSLLFARCVPKMLTSPWGRQQNFTVGQCHIKATGSNFGLTLGRCESFIILYIHKPTYQDVYVHCLFKILCPRRQWWCTSPS